MPVLEIRTKGILISLYGSKKDIETSEAILKKHSNELSGCEKEDRLLLMKLIPEYKMKAFVLYEGNSVYDNVKIIRNLKSIKKHGMHKMSDYTYRWLINATGSIAHYNKNGWIDKYPTVQAFRMYLNRNEFGLNIVQYVPNYNSSNKILAIEVMKLFSLSW